MKKLILDSNPVLKELFFDQEKAQFQAGQTDFLIIEGPALREFLGGIAKAFEPLANEILCEAGKYAGKDYVARLIEKGVKSDEVPEWLFEFFTNCGWGHVYLQVLTENREVVISVENCVTARNVNSKQPVCHFIKGYFSGVYEAVWSDITDCNEVLCSAKGDPFCEFRVFRMFKSQNLK